MSGKQWLSSRVLNAASLDNLYDLNRRFLDTLAATAPRRLFTHASSLHERIAAGVARLNGERREAFAHNPFSLFDAHFSDGAFWKRLTAAVHERAMSSAEASDMQHFGQMALFYAWHLARADTLAARILLGMSDQTVEVFSRLSLPYLQQLVLTDPQLITPRWPDRDTVWQILLGAAQLGPSHLEEIRMFGIQLIAGDLAGSIPGNE